MAPETRASTALSSQKTDTNAITADTHTVEIARMPRRLFHELYGHERGWEDDDPNPAVTVNWTEHPDICEKHYAHVSEVSTDLGLETWDVGMALLSKASLETSIPPPFLKFWEEAQSKHKEWYKHVPTYFLNEKPNPTITAEGIVRVAGHSDLYCWPNQEHIIPYLKYRCRYLNASGDGLMRCNVHSAQRKDTSGRVVISHSPAILLATKPSERMPYEYIHAKKSLW